jgi:hypothetical protein
VFEDILRRVSNYLKWGAPWGRSVCFLDVKYNPLVNWDFVGFLAYLKNDFTMGCLGDQRLPQT